MAFLKEAYSFLQMSTLNISLPDPMRTYVEEETKNGGYSTVSEYMRTLIRKDQKRKAGERLEALLLEGLESAEAGKLGSDDWKAIRQQVRARSEGRNDRTQ
jgi:antitoxin ParD1/3/4